jgi:hypothetical protein
METQEIWKDIPWYEWLYQASNLWKIKSLKFGKEKILAPLLHGVWYLSIVLCNNWIRKKAQIHRLVASCFLWLDLFSFTDNKKSLCVCHKDDNPSNNHVDNLFLGTRKDNNMDMHTKGRHTNWWKWRNWSKHHASKKVYQIKDWHVINYYNSTHEASRLTSIKQPAIWKCAIWKANSAWWYQWKYNI